MERNNLTHVQGILCGSDGLINVWAYLGQMYLGQKVSSSQKLIYIYLINNSDNRSHVSWWCYKVCFQLLLLQIK